jgi:hypothetical protein
MARGGCEDHSGLALEALGPKREAERYLFKNSVDLSLVCQSAGIDIGQLRTCLNKVRGQSLEDVLRIAA